MRVRLSGSKGIRGQQYWLVQLSHEAGKTGIKVADLSGACVLTAKMQFCTPCLSCVVPQNHALHAGGIVCSIYYEGYGTRAGCTYYWLVLKASPTHKLQYLRLGILKPSAYDARMPYGAQVGYPVCLFW